MDGLSISQLEGFRNRTVMIHPRDNTQRPASLTAFRRRATAHRLQQSNACKIQPTHYWAYRRPVAGNKARFVLLHVIHGVEQVIHKLTWPVTFPYTSTVTRKAAVSC